MFQCAHILLVCIRSCACLLRVCLQIVYTSLCVDVCLSLCHLCKCMWGFSLVPTGIRTTSPLSVCVYTDFHQYNIYIFCYCTLSLSCLWCAGHLYACMVHSLKLTSVSIDKVCTTLAVQDRGSNRATSHCSYICMCSYMIVTLQLSLCSSSVHVLDIYRQ